MALRGFQKKVLTPYLSALFIREMISASHPLLLTYTGNIIPKTCSFFLL